MDRTREDLFDDYDLTILSVDHPQWGWTDPALVAIERSQRAVVITAWHPGFLTPTLAVNRAADARLQADLRERGFEAWRALGTAPGGEVLDEGWIVWGMPVDEALALAQAYGQFAIFAFDEAGLRVTIACAPDNDDNRPDP